MTSVKHRMPIVLLVEDDTASYELLSEHLASEGFEVYGASDGSDALETAKRVLPDVVITDYALPGINGCELTRMLRGDPATANCRVILLTGHVGPRVREAAREAGCHGFLLKPMHLDDLVHEIRRVLEHPHRVLIVEDDRHVRESLSDALSEEGYVAATASNGMEALDYLHAHEPPDVIVLDLMMPVMNGWEFLIEKRRDPKLAAIPVVVVTAAKEAAGKLNEPMLSKPVTIAKLVGALQSFH
jgi:adenylate cyclase